MNQPELVLNLKEFKRVVWCEWCVIFASRQTALSEATSSVNCGQYISSRRRAEIRTNQERGGDEDPHPERQPRNTGRRAVSLILSDPDLADFRFYVRDGSRVGFSGKEEITDVNAERHVKKTLRDCFISLVEFNIPAFQPTVLYVAFCFSLMSDVTAALRACGDMKDLCLDRTAGSSCWTPSPGRAKTEIAGSFTTIPR